MRRKVGLILVFGAALPLAVASVAWACGVLATLTLDKKVAAPGQALTATGRNYANTTEGGASPVAIRLKSRSGQVLSTVAASNGKIEDTFTLPANTSPGWYVVLATQTTATGTQKSGTPGRTTLRVQSASKSAEVVPAAPWGSSNGGSGSQSPLVLILAAGLSLTMLVGGWKVLSRKRTASNPHLAV